MIGFWTAFQLIRRALRGEGSVDERLGSHSDNGNDYKGLIGYGAYSMLFSLLGSELQLKWNNLDGIAGVDSTGQILSLVIGCFTLFRSLALLVRKGFGNRHVSGPAREIIDLQRQLAEKEKKINQLKAQLGGKETGLIDLEKGKNQLSNPSDQESPSNHVERDIEKDGTVTTEELQPNKSEPEE